MRISKERAKAAALSKLHAANSTTASRVRISKAVSGVRELISGAVSGIWFAWMVEFWAGLAPQNGSQEDLQANDLQGVHGTDGFQVRFR
jgi:hypothetical protein